MEMHHKLRRDPAWHPSACNICGQLGHQAAQCTNGTINWRQLYGDESFRLKQPLYESDLVRMHKEKAPDLAALAAQAKQYVAMQSNNGGEALANGTQQQAVVADGAQADVKPEAAAASLPAKSDLPPGWNVTKDTAGRPYYWHAKTKKTTWEKPTADTPIS